jgi:DNA-binding NarL/FixJ family response regulator
MRRQTGASQPGGHRLTPQEWRIAWAAAQGQTSREIATQVFLSTRTVDYHLGIIYRKLGVRSRRELIRTMGADGQPRDAFDAGA